MQECDEKLTLYLASLPTRILDPSYRPRERFSGIQSYPLSSCGLGS
jgi:hypothetical protein